ncbi:MAG: retroviral-like aspartic protease family protein, partial [Tannerella sp.]|nr:retroviral-like aspartic protease family protein [Tannerella sp.]
MNEFKIDIYKGHAIIKSDENVILIDTGAPYTIHRSDNLCFCSENFRTSSNYMGVTVQKISEMLGMEITTLLGTNVLSEYKLLLDYKNKSALFSKTDIDFTGQQTTISSFMGIPIIELEINRARLKFFLDTGAQLSYLSSNYTSKYESTGSIEDFYPGVGIFQTNCYEINTKLDNYEFNVRYGNLPSLLQATLMMSGTNGIIGYDFFNN